MVLGEPGLVLEVEVLAGAERGLEGRLNGARWKKLLVGLAERHTGSPLLLPSFSARPGSPSRKGMVKMLRSGMWSLSGLLLFLLLLLSSSSSLLSAVLPISREKIRSGQLSDYVQRPGGTASAVLL